MSAPAASIARNVTAVLVPFICITAPIAERKPSTEPPDRSILPETMMNRIPMPMIE